MTVRVSVRTSRLPGCLGRDGPVGSILLSLSRSQRNEPSSELCLDLFHLLHVHDQLDGLGVEEHLDLGALCLVEEFLLG